MSRIHEALHNGKGKIKTRLWFTLLRRKSENQVDDSGTGGARGGPVDVWFVGRKKNHFRSAYS